MKRAVATTAVLAALASPAAAQQPRWQGPYIGAHLGIGTGDTKFRCVGDSSDCSSMDGTFKIDGTMIGGQVGYNWVLHNGLVTGIEADISFSDISGDAFFGGKNQASSLDTIGTIRGRLGKEITPGMIAFATAGLAIGKFTDSATIVITPNEWKSTQTGWTAGFGVESALSERVSLKFEYLYMDFGTASHAFDEARLGTGTAKFDHDLHTLRVGLNFKLP